MSVHTSLAAVKSSAQMPEGSATLFMFSPVTAVLMSSGSSTATLVLMLATSHLSVARMSSSRSGPHGNQPHHLQLIHLYAWLIWINVICRCMDLCIRLWGVASITSLSSLFIFSFSVPCCPRTHVGLPFDGERAMSLWTACILPVCSFGMLLQGFLTGKVYMSFPAWEFKGHLVVAVRPRSTFDYL